jgi:hypothetical protein
MQNKANLRNDKMSINLYTTKDYEKNADFRHGKTKPKQTQFKANKAKNKPNLTQNKPNSKNESFCVDKELYGCFLWFPHGIYYPKGYQFYFLLSQNAPITHYIPRTRIFNNFMRCCYV